MIRPTLDERDRLRPAQRVRALASSALLAMGLAACGGGAGTAGSRASGSLTVTGCVIAPGAASCSGSIAWTTSGATAPRLVFRGATLAHTAAGRVDVTLGPSIETATLLDAGLTLDEDSLQGLCASAHAWDGAACRAYARRLDERAPTPFEEQGRPVSLEVVVFEPLTPGPHPAVVFHHGSTGNGSDPSLFTLTFTNEGVAQFFVERGFLVAFPQRRGRGRSDGLYDEGFTPDRSRYSCLSEAALAGFERALQDVDAAVAYVRARPTTDPTRLVSAGTSRGGVLAVAHAGRRPEIFDGVVNFVGGWLGEGCLDAPAVNRTAFAFGAPFARPTLWLYGANDSFYSLAHSRGNFDAFQSAGGRGAFVVYTRPSGLNGHFILNDPALWTADLDAYVRAVVGP
jgi:dienelactone hydrolase